MTDIVNNNAMLLEHVNCDLCGSNDYVVRYRKPDNWLWLNNFEYPVVECLNCGLVYVNPRPVFEEMGKFYPEGYHDGRNDELHLQRYVDQFDYISKFKVAAVLDIGCARGDWLNYINDQWPTVELHGVDAFSDGVKGGNIVFYKTQLHEAALPKAHFDLITSWAVIEHVHTPDAYFNAVNKLLKPGGKFVFLVTNSESIYGKYAYKEDIPRHLYHFNAKSLGGYAKKHGLQLDDISFDERFWDGSGKGAFRFAMAKILGITWYDMKKNNFTVLEKILLRLAWGLDRFAFCCNWESRVGKSGIIVVTMSKASI